jgi:predicted DsbA family dithiol-disulfide isomerase
MPIHIEIWSDVACPWCMIGKRRFEAALDRFDHRDEVTVTFRAFELDPGAPAERPGDHTAHLARKYGTSIEQAQAMHDRMTQAAAAEGVTFDFARVRGANTFDAHRLVRLALDHGLQLEMKDRLMRAYFGEGALVSDHATLRALAAEVGVPGDAVAELLAGDLHADSVRQDEALAQAIGITAVPFFVANRQIGATGAQDPEVLLDFLTEAWRRTQAAA